MSFDFNRTSEINEQHYKTQLYWVVLRSHCFDGYLTGSVVVTCPWINSTQKNREYNLGLNFCSSRFTPKNLHQRPTVALLCGPHVQGAQGISCGRHLANHEVEVILFLPNFVKMLDSVTSERTLFSKTGGKLVSNIKGEHNFFPPSASVVLYCQALSRSNLFRIDCGLCQKGLVVLKLYQTTMEMMNYLIAWLQYEPELQSFGVFHSLLFSFSFSFFLLINFFYCC